MGLRVALPLKGSEVNVSVVFCIPVLSGTESNSRPSPLVISLNANMLFRVHRFLNYSNERCHKQVNLHWTVHNKKYWKWTIRVLCNYLMLQTSKCFWRKISIWCTKPINIIKYLKEYINIDDQVTVPKTASSASHVQAIGYFTHTLMYFGFVKNQS
jgi:hypothetical protein